MKVEEYLDTVAYTQAEQMSDGSIATVYRSKYDDSYLTIEGCEENVSMLALLEVTDQLTHGVGFSQKMRKWYGWSHRAMYGFAPGSTCKPGDCHWKAANDAEELQDAIRFWSDPNRKKIIGKILRPGLIEIKFEYRSWIEELVKYWFFYPELELKFKLRMFLEYDIKAWFKDYKFNPYRIRQLIRKFTGMFTERSCISSMLHEYDPNNFGRGTWTAETWADAKQMAIDFCEGVS